MPCECCKNNANSDFRDVLKEKPSSTVCTKCTSGFLRELPRHFATLAIHAGQEPEIWSTLCVTPALVTSAVFKQSKPRDKSSFERICNPTRAVLEECLKTLYDCKYCFCFSSGMAAIYSCLGLLRAGEHIICNEDLSYSSTRQLFDIMASAYNIEVTYVDQTSTYEFEKKMKSTTRIVFVESPSIPLMKLVDITALGKITKKKKIYLIVDNTVVTPYFQNPFQYCADIVVDSLSKGTGGHNDCMAGSVCTNSHKIATQIRSLQQTMGSAIPPFDAYLLSRSLKTLSYRMLRILNNAMEVAKFLKAHAKIDKVFYPGLPSHPQYDLAKMQMSGCGGLICAYIKGSPDDVRRFATKRQYFVLATSFGGITSTIEIPATMSFACMPDEMKEKKCITPKMVLISVGIENVEDLIEDLSLGLEKIGGMVGCCK